jgi:uncharacterized protein YecA (UPF0149 family)
MMDKTELLKRSANGEELTEKETQDLIDYMAMVSNKMELDPEEIYKYMYRGVPKDERRPAQPVRSTPKIGRNEPCPCGCYGLKYKKCCGKGL